MRVTWYGSSPSRINEEDFDLEMREMGSEIWVPKQSIAPIGFLLKVGEANGNLVPQNYPKCFRILQNVRKLIKIT